MEYSMERALRKDYKIDDDYVLDVLNDVEDELWSEVINEIPEELLEKFKKWVAIKTKVTGIEVEKAYTNGYYDGIESINHTENKI